MSHAPEGYRVMQMPTHPTSSYDLSARSAQAFVCEACGALVGNTTDHTDWHVLSGTEAHR